MKVCKILILLIVLTVFAACDCRQVITGTVIDKETGQPLSEVSICKKGQDYYVKTDSAGCFRLTEITVSRDGYKTKEMKINNGDNCIIELEE